MQRTIIVSQFEDEALSILFVYVVDNLFHAQVDELPTRRVQHHCLYQLVLPNRLQDPLGQLLKELSRSSSCIHYLYQLAVQPLLSEQGFAYQSPCSHLLCRHSAGENLFSGYFYNMPFSKSSQEAERLEYQGPQKLILACLLSYIICWWSLTLQLKTGRLMSRKCRTTPKLKISLLMLSITGLFLSTQGAMKPGVPHFQKTGFSLKRRVLRPKSAITTSLRSLSLKRIFQGFKSLWTTSCLYSSRSALRSCVKMRLTAILLQYMSLSRMSSCPPLRSQFTTQIELLDQQISRFFMMFGWSSCLRMLIQFISIYHPRSWLLTDYFRNAFTDTYQPSLFRSATYTLAQVPLPNFLTGLKSSLKPLRNNLLFSRRYRELKSSSFKIYISRNQIYSQSSLSTSFPPSSLTNQARTQSQVLTSRSYSPPRSSIPSLNKASERQSRQRTATSSSGLPSGRLEMGFKIFGQLISQQQ